MINRIYDFIKHPAWHMVDYGLTVEIEYWGAGFSFPSGKTDWYWRKFRVKQALYHLWRAFLGHHMTIKIIKDGETK